MSVFNSLKIAGKLHCVKPIKGGTFGKYVFQQTRHGHGNVAGDKTRRQQVRNWVKGRNPKTPAQQTNRDAFSSAVVAWHALSSETKAQLKKDSVGTNCNAYQLFLKQQMQAFHRG
jgi:hypothetical protein